MAVIPANNPRSLVAYYAGIFALVPCVGLLPAVVALVFGILALRDFYRDPRIEGAGHAWVGIVLGGVMTLIWGALVVTAAVAALSAAFWA